MGIQRAHENVSIIDLDKIRTTAVTEEWLFQRYMDLKAVENVDVIEAIVIIRVGPSGIPPGGWEIRTTGSHIKSAVVFSTGNRMTLGFKISNHVKTGIVFSKITLFYKGSGKETILDRWRVSHPYLPGETYYLGSWDIPKEAGQYELRIHLGNRTAGSVSFNIGS